MVKVTLTPEEFENEKANIAQQTGTVLSGNDGVIAQQGVELDFHYDGKSELQIVVKHHPFFMPVAMIETHIRAWFPAQKVIA